MGERNVELVGKVAKRKIKAAMARLRKINCLNCEECNFLTISKSHFVRHQLTVHRKSRIDARVSLWNALQAMKDALGKPAQPYA